MDKVANEINILQQLISRNSGYLARAEIERILNQYKEHTHRLEKFGFKVYSQNDEDGILNEIFRRLGIDRGVFFEIGVESGLECNSHFLLHRGWKGCWVDGNSQQSDAIYAKFNDYINSRILDVTFEFASPQNINNLISQGLDRINVLAEDLDFLSIDIDGMDYYLFQALRVFPKVLCIEYNSKFPPPLDMVPVYNESYYWKGHCSDYMGSSLEAINRLSKSMGYKLIATNITGINAFLIRNDLSQCFSTDLPTSEYYNPPRYYLWADHFVSQIGHLSDVGPYVYTR